MFPLWAISTFSGMTDIGPYYTSCFILSLYLQSDANVLVSCVVGGLWGKQKAIRPVFARAATTVIKLNLSLSVFIDAIIYENMKLRGGRCGGQNWWKQTFPCGEEMKVNVFSVSFRPARSRDDKLSFSGSTNTQQVNAAFHPENNIFGSFILWKHMRRVFTALLYMCVLEGPQGKCEKGSK